MSKKISDKTAALWFAAPFIVVPYALTVIFLDVVYALIVSSKEIAERLPGAVKSWWKWWGNQ